MKELIYSRRLLQAAGWYADKIGFIDGTYRATYSRHIERVQRLCAVLRKLGVDRGARFAVMALNGHAYMELYHAAYCGAGIVNPLNLRLAPMELEYILADSGTRVCFVDAAFAPVVDQVRKAAGIDQVVLIGSGDVPHDLRYETLLDSEKPELPVEPEETDPVVLMYTGGTTGLPKGVLLDQRAEMLNLYHASSIWRFDEHT